MSKLAILYTRYSSDLQTGNNSVERQEAMFKAFLDSPEGADYTTSDAFRYSDNGVSGFTGSHILKGDFGRLLEDIEKGRFKDFPSPLLCIENVDRFGRQKPTEAIGVMTSILSAGVDIYFMSSRQMLSAEEIANDDMKLIMFVLESSRAHRESVRKSKMVKSAWDKAQGLVEDGHQLTRNVPWWINPENKNEVFRISDVAEEHQPAAIVGRAFKMRLSMSCNKIAKEFNLEGVPVYSHHVAKEGKEYKRAIARDKYTGASISALLNNKAVMGILKEQSLSASNSIKVDSGKRDVQGNPVMIRQLKKGLPPLRGDIPDYFPQIVNPALFAAVQLLKEEYLTDAETGEKKPTGRKSVCTQVNSIKLFKGLMRCSACNGAISAYGSREKYAGVYQCVNRRSLACDAVSISRKEVDDALLKRLLPSLNKLNVNDTLEQQLAKLENTRSQVIKDIDSASDLVGRLTGLAQEKQVGRLNILSKEHADLNTQIEAIKTKRNASDYDSVDHLDLSTFEGRFEAQIIIKRAFKRIVLDTEKRQMNVTIVNGNEYIGFEVDGNRDLRLDVRCSDEINRELSALTGVAGGVIIPAGDFVGSDAPDYSDWPDAEEPDYPNTDDR